MDALDERLVLLFVKQIPILKPPGQSDFFRHWFRTPLAIVKAQFVSLRPLAAVSSPVRGALTGMPVDALVWDSGVGMSVGLPIAE